MSLNIDRASAFLKEMYPADVVQNMTYEDRPFYAMLNKDENFYGELRKVPLQYGNTNNRSTSFTVAKAGNGYIRTAGFNVERVSNYSFASIDNETILATESNDGAFMQAMERSMKGAFDSLANSLGFGVIADGSYKIGQRSSVSAGVMTLTDDNDVVNFEVGTEFQACATLSGGTVRTGYSTVTAVDREAGEVTFTGTITGFADDDYIYPRGDYDAGISGAGAWIPYGTGRSTALAAAFNGVTRSADETRLGGWYKDYSTLPIEEALVKFVTLLTREGSKPDCIFVNPMKWADLALALGSKVQYIDTMIAGVSFEGIRIHGPKGIVKIYSDRWIPYDYALVTQMNTWTLASLGPAIRVFDTDGLRVLRSQTIDGVDIQLCSYAQVENNAPGYSGWVKLS